MALRRSDDSWACGLLAGAGGGGMCRPQSPGQAGPLPAATSLVQDAVTPAAFPFVASARGTVLEDMQTPCFSGHSSHMF